MGCSVAPLGSLQPLHTEHCCPEQKTLGLRSLFFQAPGSLHLVWGAVGEDEERCSGPHRSQSIQEAQGCREPSAQAAGLCLGFGERYPHQLPWWGHIPPSSAGTSSRAGFHRGGTGPVKFKHSNYGFCHPQGFLMHHSGATSCPGAPFHSQ